MLNTISTVYYLTNQVAKYVGTSNSSILRWADQLTEAGYSFERDEMGQYRFKDQDIEVFQRFKSFRDNKHSLPVCAAKVVEELKNVLIPIESDEDADSKSVAPANYLDELIEAKVRERLSPLIERFHILDEQLKNYELLQKQVQALPQPPSEQEIRRIARDEEKLRARLTFDVKTRLRERACKAWYEKPERERVIRVGLFKKIENESLKNEFIRAYVAAHFEDELNKEYAEFEKKDNDRGI